MRCSAALLALLALVSHAPCHAQEPGAGVGAGAADAQPPRPRFRVYVGTYTGGPSGSKGVYQFELDTANGVLTPKGLAAEATNPSFLAIHPSGRFLYAANEVGTFKGEPTGAISAFAIEPKEGKLTLLNQVGSGGADPCFVAVDATGRDVLAANYSGGSVCVLPVLEDGKLGPASSTIRHKGSSVDKGRQAGPHAHSINLDANNRIAVAADLGLDKLLLYRFDAERGELSPNIPADAPLTPGSGPRHFAFHPDGRHAYVINEMASTVTVFDYDGSRGALSELQTISTRPADASKPGNSTAEVVVHPSGRYLYGSNRGDDALAIYAIDPASAKLTLVGFQSTGGKTPRNFAIDPTGGYLLAANQDSDTIVVFRVDPQTGKLAQVAAPVKAPRPVCIRFLPIVEPKPEQ